MSARAYVPARFNHAELVYGKGARLNSALALQVGGEVQGQQPCLVKQTLLLKPQRPYVPLGIKRMSE